MEIYVFNRQQSIKINNVFSQIKKINIGLSQGTIMGPFLILVYTNVFSTPKG